MKKYACRTAMMLGFLPYKTQQMLTKKEEWMDQIIKL